MRKRHAVHQSINKPILLLWVDYRIFMAGLFAGFLVLNIIPGTDGILAALLAFASVWVFGLIVAKDRHYVGVLLASWNLRRGYDPCRRGK